MSKQKLITLKVMATDYFKKLGGCLIDQGKEYLSPQEFMPAYSRIVKAETPVKQSKY